MMTINPPRRPTMAFQGAFLWTCPIGPTGRVFGHNAVRQINNGADLTASSFQGPNGAKDGLLVSRSGEAKRLYGETDSKKAGGLRGLETAGIMSGRNTPPKCKSLPAVMHFHSG